jgi:hypothetical protein
MRRCDHLRGRDFGTAPGKCAETVIRPASHGVAAGSRSFVVLFASFRSRRVADNVGHLLQASRFRFDQRVEKRKEEN